MIDSCYSDRVGPSPFCWLGFFLNPFASRPNNNKKPHWSEAGVAAARAAGGSGETAAVAAADRGPGRAQESGHPERGVRAPPPPPPLLVLLFLLLLLVPLPPPPPPASGRDRCECERECVCVCVCVCVRERVRGCVRACVCESVSVCPSVRAGTRGRAVRALLAEEPPPPPPPPLGPRPSSLRSFGARAIL